MQIFKRKTLITMFNDLLENRIWKAEDYGYWIENYFWVDYLIDKYILKEEKSKYDYQFDTGKYEKGEKLENKKLEYSILSHIENEILKEIKFNIVEFRKTQE